MRATGFVPDLGSLERARLLGVLAIKLEMLEIKHSLFVLKTHVKVSKQ